jgi:quinol monooxygenase YgiN
VTFQIKEGTAEEFAKAFKPCLAATVKEDGCKAYELCADADDKHRFALFEEWKTVEALEKHLQTDHVKGLFAAIGPTLAENGVKLQIFTKAA